MEDLSFHNRLQIYGYRLSKSEQKIAEYIGTHIEQAISASSVELSQMIGTSNSTLTRFCKKMDYRNFSEFQTLLSKERRPIPVPNKTLQRVSQYYEKVIAASSELVKPDELDLFVKRIQKADRILVTGLGSSGLTASEFNMRLVQMGFTSSAMTDSFLMRVQTSLFSPKDLVIAISSSGETMEVVSACRIAKSVGAQIALITQNNQTTLSKIADAILFAGDARQVNDPLFINSQMSLMLLIDAISYRLLEDENCREQRNLALHILFHRQI